MIDSIKRMFRNVVCKLNLNHRVVEEWTPLKESGLTPSSAALWGCTMKDGKVNSYKCVDCGTVLAPFEQARVRYPLAVERSLREGGKEGESDG